MIRLVADVTRLRAATGRQPEFGLADGLAHTIGFFCDPASLARCKTGIYDV